MKKPKNIDQNAQWKYNAWHKGEMLKEGIPIGKYSIWDEKGNQMTDGAFDNQGNIIWCKTYYPDGTVGRDIRYDEESNTTKVVYRSYHEYFSKLLTPMEIGEKGYGEKIYKGKVSITEPEISNGSTEGITFYNDNGEFLNTYSEENYTSLIEKYTLKKGEKETWQEALNRLDKCWNEIKEQYKRDTIELEYDYFSVRFDKSVTKDDLDKAEERLGISFPISYRDFVLNHGLITFGTELWYTGQTMLPPSEIHHIEMKLDSGGGGYFEDSFSISKEKREKVICFFKDDEDIQYDGWLAFDYTIDEGDEKNVILQVGAHNIEEWEEKLGKKADKNLNSMDDFISKYVNKLLKIRSEEL